MSAAYRSNKGGRPAKYIVDNNGNTVNGLSATTKRNKEVYYTLVNGKMKLFGSDKTEAIRKFLAFQKSPQLTLASTDKIDTAKNLISILSNARQSIMNPQDPYNDKEPIYIPHINIAVTEIDKIFEQCLSFAETIEATVNIDDDVFFERMRKEITENPKLCANKTGIEELAYLRDLDKPETTPMSTVWRLYNDKTMNKGRVISKDTKDKALRIWKDFLKHVPVANVDDITKEMISRYGKYLNSKYNPNTIHTTLCFVLAVFNFAEKRVEKSQSPAIAAVKNMIEVFVERPKRNIRGGHPITKEDLKLLLSVASIKERAIMLTSLNLALHVKEMSQVKLQELDLENKTFRTIRTKTEIQRSAVLWDETIDAIKAHLKDRTSSKDILFLNQYNEIFKKQASANIMARLQKKVKLSQAYTFDSFRDSFAKHAKNNDGKRIVMGHKLQGVLDNYDTRSPDSAAVIQACSEVHKYYFG